MNLAILAQYPLFRPLCSWSIRLCYKKVPFVSLGPSVRRKVEEAIRQQLGAGHGILKVAKMVGVGSGTVQRVRQEMAVSALDIRAGIAGMNIFAIQFRWSGR